jgi:DNA repair photolyase
MPVVVFENRCPQACLYCDLCERGFDDEEVIASGRKEVLEALVGYGKAYFSAVTDCLLGGNEEITYELLNGVWQRREDFMPLVITKQVISERILALLAEHSGQANVFVSVPSLNDDLLALLEPGAAKASDRIESIGRLTEAGVDVVAVIMPWFNIYEEGESIEDLPAELARVGVRYCVLGTGVLPEIQLQKFLSTGNAAIIRFVREMQEQQQVATKIGYVMPLDRRVELFGEMIAALTKHGIQGKICTADNPDFDVKSGLPLCAKANEPLCATLTSSMV